MEDEKIIDLYWLRDETAIAETGRKYGGLCQRIAQNILADREDAQECVNDTYFALWNRLPPERPRAFQAFIATVTRNLSIRRLRARSAQKRGGGAAGPAWDELAEVLASGSNVEQAAELSELTAAIDRFLATLSCADRVIFLGRYWFFAPVADIAQRLGCTESRVKTSLFRTRQKLQGQLIKEGLL